MEGMEGFDHFGVRQHGVKEHLEAGRVHHCRTAEDGRIPPLELACVGVRLMRCAPLAQWFRR
jgi:hypothetical protein